MAAAAAGTTAARKVRYIGRRTTNFGRPLWEIVLNLKDFGKGRLVVRSTYERYPEPTYYKIVHAEPHIFQYPDNMRGHLYAEPVFRGRPMPLVDLGRIAHKDDYRLLHKHEEEAYKNRGPLRLEPTHILPRYGSLPPTWIEVFKREKGRELTLEEKRIRMCYNESSNTLYRIAEEDEKPSYEAGPGAFKPAHMSLYEQVVWTRQKSEKHEDTKVGES